MSDPILLAAVDDLGPGDALRISSDITGTEDDVALFCDDDGEFYALDDTCSHEEASLSEGWVEAGEVECPLHSARFCLKNGAPMCMPATRPVATHRIEVRDGSVWLLPPA